MKNTWIAGLVAFVAAFAAVSIAADAKLDFTKMVKCMDNGLLLIQSEPKHRLVILKTEQKLANGFFGPTKTFLRLTTPTAELPL